MQVSPIFDAVWKTMRRCPNGPVGFAFAAALLVAITYQLVSKPATAQGIIYALSGKAAKSGTATHAATLLAQFSQRGPKFSGTGAVGIAGQSGGNQIAVVSAASFTAPVAPDSIAAAFGVRLATQRATAPNGAPLPTTLGGTTVRVNGVLAPLFFVSDGQVNFLIPASTALGNANVTITAGDGTVSTGVIQIAAVTPAIFTARANGRGIPAAILLRVAADGKRTTEVLTSNAFAFLAPGERIFLLLFPSGIRRANDPNNDGNVRESVHVLIGADEYTPDYAGAQGSLFGLDQINLEIPRCLIGRGQVTVQIKVGTVLSNPVEIVVGGQDTRPATTTTITPSPNPSFFGQAVTFTAQVRQGTNTPSGGTVTFKDGSNNLDTRNLDGTGRATFSTSSFAVGPHQVTAEYSGNCNFKPSSGTIQQTVTVNCQMFTISPTSQSFAASAATGSVNVSAAPGCGWTATSNAAWITITSGASGSGNGIVTFSVAANTSTNSRSGTLTAAGQTLTITQTGINCPTFTINPTNANFTAGGGTGNVSVTAASGCPWTAASNANWITINSGASSSGNGTINYAVAANTGPARTGTMTIAGQTFTVSQASGCTFTLTFTSQSFAAGGGTGNVNVASVAGCAWTATSNANWLTITAGASGSGNGTVNYSVAANNGPARSGTLTIAGQTFTVSQAAGCTYTLNHTSQDFGIGGGTDSVNVTAGAGCAWAALSNANWITINSGASGTGNGAVNYSVAANGGPARSGTLTTAGQTLTVSQASGCAVTLSATARNVTAAATTGSINVTAGANCVWTATSNANWLTITSGASGTGNGTVNYSVAANIGAARTGTLSIGGVTFTVTQDAAACSFTLSSSSKDVVANATTATVNVTTASHCAWTAVSNAAWLTISSGASGTGNGTVTYSVFANSGPARTGTLTIAGQTFTVNQASGCSYSLSANQQNAVAAGGNLGVNVTTSANCAWMATSNVNWITITSGQAAVANGTVNYSVAANVGPARIGTMTIAGQTFTVNQASGTQTLSITTTSLATATVGVGYQQGIAVTGGQTPYSWSVSSGLPPGLALNTTFGSIFSTPTAAGTFTFTVTVRDAGNPQQTDSRTYSLTVAPGTPDLVVDALTAPSTGTIGATISVSMTVRNQGTAATGGGFRVGFYYSTDATITTADVFSGVFCNELSSTTQPPSFSGPMQGLGAGASKSCSGPVIVPTTLPAGTYYLGAIADDQGQVMSESNESNNTRSAGPVSLSSGACSNQVVETMYQEYRNPTYGNTLRPTCSDFTSSGGSTNFNWSELNDGWSGGSAHPQLGMVKASLTTGLKATRVNFGNNPIYLSSGYRCPHGNQNVGGVVNSAHTHGRAADMYSTRNHVWTQQQFLLLRNAAVSANGSCTNWDMYPNDRHLHCQWP